MNYRWIGSGAKGRDPHKKHTLTIIYVFVMISFAEREGGSEAKMGFPTAGKTTKRHYARMPRGLCAEHNEKGQPLDMRPLQSRPEG